MPQILPLIDRGKRALIAGSTGSGKSVLAKWLISRSPSRWVILNPKHTLAYQSLDDAVIVRSLEIGKTEKEMKRHRFVIVNPDSVYADPDTLDDYVMQLHTGWQNLGLVCDELYTMHKGGVAGKGLLGWLTRGRELKQSFVGLTQRPAWLSQFLFSESDYLCSMRLGLTKDRKRMIEMTDNEMMGSKIKSHDWLWFPVVSEKLVHYGPVPLDTG